LINLDENNNRNPRPGEAGAEIFSCQHDFIAVNYIRLCGSKVNNFLFIFIFIKISPLTLSARQKIDFHRIEKIILIMHFQPFKVLN
jgi:hypothetical protein